MTLSQPAVDPAWLSLCPTLSDEVRWQARRIRGETWWLMHNRATGEQIRIDRRSARLARKLDGTHSLRSLLGSVAPDEAGQPGTQDDAAAQLNQLLVVLLRAGLVQTGGDREAMRLLQATLGREQAARTRRWLSPLALRIALCNPDRWLASLLPWVSWLYGRASLIGAALLASWALWLAISHASELHEAIAGMAQTPGHWWHLLLVYPFMKVAHELAHGLTLKRFGGSVHEMGLSFLVFMPVPHVDASDAWRLERVDQRILVSAVGVIAEVLMACAGVVLWAHVSPGLLRDLALACAVTGIGSTVLFNANPLLRFDGYFVLQDALDIPNLAARSASYWRYLARRWLFGVAQARSPVTAVGECRWFVGYGLLSWLYRWVVMLGISLFLLKHLAALGVMLALLSLWQLVVAPAVRLVRYLWGSPELAGIRRRAIAICGAMLACVLLLLGPVPMASSTRVPGVVWVPAQAEVFAAEAGQVAELQVMSGQWVEQGAPIARLVDPVLQGRLPVVAARLDELDSRYHMLRTSDPPRAQALSIERETLFGEYRELRRRVEALQVVAPSAGRFAPVDDQPLRGRWLLRGQALGYLVDETQLVVRTVVEQAHMGRLQSGVRSGSVWFAGAPFQRWPIRRIREVPAANQALPSPLLAYDGHVGIAVATRNEQMTTLEPVFHLELALPPGIARPGIGGLAYVTLQHAPESLGRRLWRHSRQWFLRNMTT